MTKTSIHCDVCGQEKTDCARINFAVYLSVGENSDAAKMRDARYEHLRRQFDVCRHCLAKRGIVARGPMCAEPNVENGRLLDVVADGSGI